MAPCRPPVGPTRCGLPDGCRRSRRVRSTIPLRPETAPLHGGVKLAEFRGFLGVYERISGNGDAPFGALAPILRIRLCGPICTTKPSAQSLLFLCAREPGQQRCPRSRDSFAAGRRSDLPGKSVACSGRPVRPTTITRTDSTSGWGNNRGKVTSSTDDAALSMNMVSVRSVASSPPSVRPPAFRS